MRNTGFFKTPEAAAKACEGFRKYHKKNIPFFGYKDARVIHINDKSENERFIGTILGEPIGKPFFDFDVLIGYTHAIHGNRRKIWISGAEAVRLTNAGEKFNK